MIQLREIQLDEIQDFWDKQIYYLVDDKIVTEEEDIQYFKSRDYRDIIEDHMRRKVDTHHVLYFVEDEKEIGATQYCTYQSEDGKCFILDFWIYPEYRGHGKGRQCFRLLEEHTKEDGAKYYELNAEGERRISFWKSLGFEEHGRDEYDMPLWIKK